MRHLTPLNSALALLCLAFIVRALDNSGIWWPMLLAWGGGLVSGILVCMAWLGERA